MRISTPYQLRIVVAQLNLLVGDIKSNLNKIKKTASRAKNEFNADLIVFSEMALTSYPPEDLLLRSELYSEVESALQALTEFLPNAYILVGYPEKTKMLAHNAAALLHHGKIVAKYYKQLLPNYGVFDEKRYFVPGNKPCVINIKGIKVGLTICEDLWFPEPMQMVRAAGAQIAININASPFDLYKPFTREKTMGERAREGKMPLIYANCVGGQDELIFDGGSFVLNAEGEITQRGKFFQEQIMPIDLEYKNGTVLPKQHRVLPIISKEERIYKALVLGVRDYIEKNHFPGAIIGISGGIDSALTLAIAVDAIGKDRVHTVFMPSRYTRTISGEDAKTLAENFGVEYAEISIERIFQAYLQSLASELVGDNAKIAEENLQARCRGAILMAISNQKNYIVLATGNKSEMSVGYATLYGDMVGGFCVLKDVPKTLVYELANYRNELAGKFLIPERSISRPPSAELRHDQIDTDILPPYPILDAILERYIEQDQTAQQIIDAGFEAVTVKKVIFMVNHNEYKRRQAPVGVRITPRAFGRDRRYPITSKFEI